MNEKRMRGTSAEIREAARRLRHQATPAERVLWDALRDRQVDGLRFRRQHPVDRFVLDFYCPSVRLVIELDGGIHAEQLERDAARDAALRALGCHVIRIPNEAVFRNLPAVLRRISITATALGSHEEPTATSPPRPLAGEGAGG
ncbi:MAG: hypothetical protein JWM27_1338 [Gemmatimonadetes bacterium]|nr:hypothetical protein [Gemmatimonadota bacterium]